MAERAVPPPDMAPAEFFTRWVPLSVDADPARRARLAQTDATLEFELVGEGGGHFTLRVEQGRVVGQVGPAAEADLRIQVDVATWRELNSGALAAPEALLKRRLHMKGNLALAIKLHLILG